MGVQRPPLETLWVDMGLPSGNRWAVSNLDVNGPYYFQESPYQYGCSYFSWGNTTPHNPDSDGTFDYDFSADYANTPGSQLSGDLSIDNNASRVLLGSPWRTPSRYDYTELVDSSDLIDNEGNVIPSSAADITVTVNGVVGVRLRSRYNGAVIFFPLTSFAVSSSLYDRGVEAYFGTVNSVNNTLSYVLRIQKNRIGLSSTFQRRYGCTIRPIWNPRDLRG